MGLEQILTIAIASAPAVLSAVAVAIISAIAKKFTNKRIDECIDHVDKATAEIKSSKEYEEVKQQLVLVHQENVQLKRKLNELLTKIDRVARSDDEE